MKRKWNLWKKVFATEDRGLLHTYLCEVEAEIKGIVGDDPSEFYIMKCPGVAKLKRIDNLLYVRRNILDNLFSYTKEEIKRIEEVNELLSQLTIQMYHRTANLYRTILKNGTDETFDDDYEVEGTLDIGVLYDIVGGDYDTMLHLNNDADCGSDFSYMLYVIQLNAEEEHHRLQHIHECHIRHDHRNTPEMTDKELHCDYTSLDDGKSWDEYLQRADLEHICFCYAFHSLFLHHRYSLADIIHINRFVVEAKLSCQRITDLRGRRYEEIREE